MPIVRPDQSSGGGGGGGSVNSVTAGDTSITVAGTAADPTVAVAALGVTTAKLADSSVTSAKIVDGTITDTDVAAANKDGAAGTASMRTLGTGAAQATAGNDSRLSDSRAPSGSAGGDLSGSYPNPSVAALAITDAKVAAANKDGAAGTASMRTLGTGAAQAASGADTRLPFVVARASDSSPLTSQTVLQSDTALIVPVTAASQWWIFATLLFSAANTAMDIKMGWSVPAAAVMTWGAGPSTTTSTVNVFAIVAVGNTPASLLSESGALSVGSRAGTSGVQLAAYATIGANAGNVTFQWAQNTSDAGALTLLTGSMLVAWRIA